MLLLKREELIVGGENIRDVMDVKPLQSLKAYSSIDVTLYIIPACVFSVGIVISPE